MRNDDIDSSSTSRGCSTLKGADVVAIAQLREQILQNPPIAFASRETIGALEMVFQILLDPVIVDQRVVHVDEEDDRMRWCHAALPAWPFVPAARQISGLR
jgi:hypothetical protein